VWYQEKEISITDEMEVTISKDISTTSTDIDLD